MIDEKKLYKEITLRLDDIHIRHIIDINHIILKGFRTNKKLTGIKLNGARTKLSNKQYIKGYVDTLLKYYTDTSKYDFSWALVESVDVEEVKRKIDENFINEGEALLALLWAERKNILIEYLQIESVNEEKEESKNKDSISIIKIKDESPKENSTTENLRKIIKNLEEENQRYKTLLNQKNQAVQDLGTQVIASKDQNDKLKKKLNEKLSKLEVLDEEVELLSEKVNQLTIEKEEKKQNTKLRLTCIGAKYIDNFVIHYLRDKEKIEYEILSPETLDQLEKYSNRQIVILAESLNRNETAKIRDNSSINFYNCAGRVKICNDAHSFIDFIEKVGKIYE